jgi:hypothetical protein
MLAIAPKCKAAEAWSAEEGFQRGIMKLYCI